MALLIIIVDQFRPTPMTGKRDMGEGPVDMALEKFYLNYR